MSGALFPNVPALPGVPALLRLGVAQAPLPVLAVADALGLQGLIGGSQWGIFDGGGNSVLPVSAVLEVGIIRDFEISTAPVEAGGFASYNKVTRPFQGRVRVAVGGTDAERSTFLTALEGIVKSTALYSVVMPEFVYPSANVTHYDFRRTSRAGATLLQVDIWLEEVRQIASQVYTSTQSINGAAPVSGGTVVTDPVIPVYQSAIGAAGVQ